MRIVDSSSSFLEHYTTVHNTIDMDKVLVKRLRNVRSGPVAEPVEFPLGVDKGKQLVHARHSLWLQVVASKKFDGLKAKKNKHVGICKLRRQWGRLEGRVPYASV